MDKRKKSATVGARTAKQRVHAGTAKRPTQASPSGAKPVPSKGATGPTVSVEVNSNLPVQSIKKLENGRDLQPSANATVLVETSLAETLSLSMHNAIINQQNSQMTTAASVTNACARLLQVPFPTLTEELTEVEPEPEEIDVVNSEDDDADYEVVRVSKKKKIMNIFNLMRSGKKSEKEVDAIEVVEVEDENSKDMQGESVDVSNSVSDDTTHSEETPNE